MKKIIVLSLLILFLVSMAWAQEKCEAPVWNVGDTWTYKFTNGQTETREVVEVSNDLFIVKIRGSQNLSAYDRKTMNLKYLIDETGKKVEAESSLRNLYDFPIVVNKKWSNTTVAKPSLGGSKYVTYLNEFEIESTEIVTISAGKFECYKIYYNQRNVSRQSKGGAIFWYSPEVKAWVKREYDRSTTYWSGPFLNAELISYKIK